MSFIVKGDDNAGDGADAEAGACARGRHHPADDGSADRDAGADPDSDHEHADIAAAADFPRAASDADAVCADDSLRIRVH